MSIKLANYNVDSKQEMRAAYCQTMIELTKSDDKVCTVDADLRGAAGMKPYAEAFPNNAFNCGVQEANMIGVSAGLSATGNIPFAHTFAPFATRRACDQIFLSCAYAKQNVKIMGSDPGVTATLNGGTHMPFEDIGIMRTFPEITVVEPADAASLSQVVRLAKETYGVWYIRLSRKNFPDIYQEAPDVQIGKSIQLREGNDVTLIATGICLSEALKAADILEAEGIKARVIDALFIKPLDEDAVIRAAKETGAIVTCENHNVINGLGSAVADVLSQKTYAPLEKVGVNDEFGEVGQLDYLLERYKLNAKEIVKKAKLAISRKGK